MMNENLRADIGVFVRDGSIPHYADMPVLAFADIADTADTR